MQCHMISQDVHVLYGVPYFCYDMTSTVIDAAHAHAQGVSERSELTQCIIKYQMITLYLLDDLKQSVWPAHDCLHHPFCQQLQPASATWVDHVSPHHTVC